MGSLGFTLADRLGAKSMPCSVPGCTRSWIQLAGQALKLGGRAEANPQDAGSAMCEPCRDKARTLSDALRSCERPGCTETWTWTVAEQLEAFAAHRPPPSRLCARDEAKLAELSDREVPCAVPGCVRNAVFSRRAQLVAGAPDVEAVPPPLKCGPCENVYGKIKDRSCGCGVRSCRNKWVWTRDEQIQAYAAGLPNEPPRRLCETCEGEFGPLADRDVRCRTSGCKNTWSWSREAQLEVAVPGKPLPKAPARMCQRCLDLYSRLRDVERPCRRAGCKRTWTEKRGAQLARAVRGKTGDPFPHYCTECEKELGELEDRQVPCKTEHCTGTWTWTRAQQLAAGVRPVSAIEAEKTAARANETTHVPSVGEAPQSGEARGGAEPKGATAAAEPGAANGPDGTGQGAVPAASPGQRKRRKRRRRREVRPPDRRCDACVAFLKDRTTREISCVQCHTPIFWPPESQLQTHLGNWPEPTLCGACRRDLTEAARAAEREALRQRASGTPTLDSDQVVPVAAEPDAASVAPTTPPSSGSSGAEEEAPAELGNETRSPVDERSEQAH